MPVVCAEFAQFLSITCSKRGRRFFWEDLTFLSSIFALPRCSSCFSPDSLSPSNTRQSSFLYHDCFSMWMPFCILDITCETWKIVILNFGFMFLIGNWPQTKGTCQKRFSGFCPLRGYPPPQPLNGQSFCQKTLSGQGGYPPPLTDNPQKNF